jgi:dihydrofolate reductase
MNNHKIYVIAAVDKNFGIGKNKDLPWDFKKDLKHFYKITTKTQDPKKQNLLIMGNTTWESIPEKFRPFKKRKNAVLAWDPDYKAKGATVYGSIDEALDSAGPDIENIFFIGGGMVYRESIQHPRLTGVYLTHINKEYDCDTFFPEIPAKFSKITKLGEDQEDGVKFEFVVYEKE